jgi:hypothetical protein
LLLFLGELVEGNVAAERNVGLQIADLRLLLGVELAGEFLEIEIGSELSTGVERAVVIEVDLPKLIHGCCRC